MTRAPLDNGCKWRPARGSRRSWHPPSSVCFLKGLWNCPTFSQAKTFHFNSLSKTNKPAKTVSSMQLDRFFERKTVVSKYCFLLTPEKVRLFTKKKSWSSSSVGLAKETYPLKEGLTDSWAIGLLGVNLWYTLLHSVCHTQIYRKLENAMKGSFTFPHYLLVILALSSPVENCPQNF